jgi:hypothetical protein
MVRMETTINIVNITATFATGLRADFIMVDVFVETTKREISFMTVLLLFRLKHKRYQVRGGVRAHGEFYR